MEDGKKEIENTISNLKRYIEIDRKRRNNTCYSEFDKFCEKHCKDIELIICVYENTARELIARGN